MSIEIDQQIADAVQVERRRVYDLFLTTPWEVDSVSGEDTERTVAVKADRFNLMRLVRPAPETVAKS